MRKIIFLLFLTSLFLNGIGQESDDSKIKIDEISQDKKYGYKATRKHSIKVGSIENEYEYIVSLTGPNGEKIYATRLGSGNSFRYKTAAFGRGYLDTWEITYEGIEEPILLYLNGYEYEKPKCPVGLGFK